MTRLANPVQLDIPNRPPTFDVQALDELVQNHGVTLLHWRGLRCPAGADAVGDVHRPHEHPQSPVGTTCHNGYLYVYAGKVRGTFLSSGVDHRLDEPGYLYDSTALVTFERTYLETFGGCGSPVETRVAPRDRLYLDSVTVTVDYQEMFEVAQNGVDRLTYPAVQVLDLYDSSLRRYTQGVDFAVDGQGRLAWTNPPSLPPSGRQVCSVRYTHRPYWYVSHLTNESRIAQADVREVTPTGVRVARQPVRLNIHARIVREYAWEKATAPVTGSTVAKGVGDAPQWGPR